VSGTQQGIGDRLWHGDVGHMDSSGHAGAPLLGGAGCEPWTQLTGGEVVCAPAQGNQVTIRSASGATLWTFDGQPFDGYLAASPDGRRIATLFAGAGESAVVHARDGTSTALPTGFEPEGWLDSGTLIGVRAPGAIQGAMAVVHLSNASRLVDLGFTGSFVGVVQNAG